MMAEPPCRHCRPAAPAAWRTEARTVGVLPGSSASLKKVDRLHALDLSGDGGLHSGWVYALACMVVRPKQTGFGC